MLIHFSAPPIEMKFVVASDNFIYDFGQIRINFRCFLLQPQHLCHIQLMYVKWRADVPHLVRRVAAETLDDVTELHTKSLVGAALRSAAFVI